MDKIVEFRGIVGDIFYQPTLSTPLDSFNISSFDINKVSPCGIVNFQSQAQLAYAKWVSPKRTRSYPFARLYDIVHAPKRITVIPIIKDEGLQGNNDRINFMTLAWMNLLNIHVILGWYESAEWNSRNRRKPNRIANQRLNNEHIVRQLHKVNQHKGHALVWNNQHFRNDFDEIYTHAVESYQRIQSHLGIELHPKNKHYSVLDSFQRNGRFDLEAFKESTLRRSQRAASRETLTTHELEALEEGSSKGLFRVQDYLGGEYHLTCDEVIFKGNSIIIQEDKNTSGKGMPSEGDIKDGLFKLILYANMEQLFIGKQEITFSTRLRITGAYLQSTLGLPSDDRQIDNFIRQNSLSKKKRVLIQRLSEEASRNNKLEIQIG